jgi:hypothetical protein
LNLNQKYHLKTYSNYLNNYLFIESFIIIIINFLAELIKVFKQMTIFNFATMANFTDDQIFLIFFINKLLKDGLSLNQIPKSY